MKTDSHGQDFLVQQEGERLVAYQCSAGVWTIGVGHTGPEVKKGLKITKERSRQLLAQDLQRFEKALNNEKLPGLNQKQFNALISFIFNLGEGALDSSLVAHLKTGQKNPELIRLYFSLWNKVNDKRNQAIYDRRLREAALFLS